MHIRWCNHFARPLTMLVACAALLGFAAQAPAASRITNGTKVDRAAYDATWASIVSVQYGGFMQAFTFAGMSSRDLHECAGTLVAPDLVLTAAHCVSSNDTLPNGINIVANTRRLSSSAKLRYGNVVGVREIVVHPSYVPSNDDTTVARGLDVALLQLTAPVPGARPMAVVGADQRALWGSGNGLRVGAQTAGWGSSIATMSPDILTDYDTLLTALAPRELRAAALPILPDRLCGSTNSFMGAAATQFDPDTMVCAGSPDTKAGAASDRVGACSGDSGGPLVVHGADGAPRLVGVVSWGPEANGPCDRASVYARVDAARDWIVATRAALADDATPATAVALSAHMTGAHTLEASWTPPATSVSRTELVQESTMLQLYASFGGIGLLPTAERERFNRALRKVSMFAPIASAGAGTSVLRAGNIAPVRPGASHRLRLRVRVYDELGRVSLSPRVVVQPSIDRKHPTAPSAPHLLGRPNGVPMVTWRRSHDDDCVDTYQLQVRDMFFRAAWRTVDLRDGGDCPTDMNPYDAMSRYDGTWQLYSLYPGRDQIRIVAVDRAGNRAPSPSATVRIARWSNDPASVCSRSASAVGTWALLTAFTECRVQITVS